MSEYQRLRRQQMLREAEGYLDLALACCDQLPLPPGVRDRLARRALEVLSQLDTRRGVLGDVAYLTGQAYRIMERHADAIRQLDKAREFDPENVHICLALGWCYKRIGRLDLAIESLEQAMEFACDDAIIYYNLACYWSLAGNTKYAIDYLTHAFDIDASFRDLVEGESDFDPIRHDPRFLELTSVIV